MKRLFVETNEFQVRWKSLGMSEDDLQLLQNYLLEHPEAGPMIQDTGGVRKLRWARSGRGKSGSLRIIYIDFITRAAIWLITAFGKDEKMDLSQDEKKTIKTFVKSL
jgi:hypothetical protein